MTIGDSRNELPIFIIVLVSIASTNTNTYFLKVLQYSGNTENSIGIYLPIPIRYCNINNPTNKQAIIGSNPEIKHNSNIFNTEVEGGGVSPYPLPPSLLYCNHWLHCTICAPKRFGKLTYLKAIASCLLGEMPFRHLFFCSWMAGPIRHNS